MTVITPIPLVPWNPSSLCAICRLVANHDTTQRYYARPLKIAAVRGCVLCRYLYEELVVHSFGRLTKDVHLEVTRHGSCLSVVDFNNTVHQFEIFTERKHPSSETPFRRIHAQPDSESCWNMIHTWLDKCTSTHTCCHQDHAPPMPNILLNVDTLRLVYGSTCEGDTRYAALSHCWGAAGTLATTLRATVESFKTGLDLHYLPSNFRDAIYATRRLGLSLLWVDALCIVQDDAESRSLDVSNMGSYYRNAYITLSMLSAHDSYVGFLNPRESAPTTSLGQNLYLRRARPSWNQVLRESPLSKRAWVLQERLLSKRIVHFEKNEIFWECLERSSREGSVEDEPEACDEGGWTKETFKRCLSFANKNIVGELTRRTIQNELFMVQWYRILCQYSGLNLTYKSDVILAIAGIAEIFRDITSFTYKSGLWIEDAHSGLLWHAEGSLMPARKPTATSNAPSWSWASLDGPVSMLFSLGSSNMPSDLAAQILECQSDPLLASLHSAHTYDDILMMDALCINVTCRSSSNGDAPYSDPYLRMVIDIFDERGICIGTGYLDRIPESNIIQCKAIVVSQRLELSLSHVPITYFLLVTESSCADACHQRVGIGQTADRIYGHVLNTLNLKPERKQKIIIV